MSPRCVGVYLRLRLTLTLTLTQPRWGWCLEAWGARVAHNTYIIHTRGMSMSMSISISISISISYKLHQHQTPGKLKLKLTVTGKLTSYLLISYQHSSFSNSSLTRSIWGRIYLHLLVSSISIFIILFDVIIIIDLTKFLCSGLHTLQLIIVSCKLMLNA